MATISDPRLPRVPLMGVVVDRIGLRKLAIHRFVVRDHGVRAGRYRDQPGLCRGRAPLRAAGSGRFEYSPKRVT